MNLFYILLLGFAVSIDGFIAGLAYGLKNISMPITSLLIVCITTILCTITAMASAYVLGTLINTTLAILLGSLILILIGLFSLFQEYLTKEYVTSKETPKLTFSIGRLVINIMANPEKADVDQSQMINPLEALFLGLALGVDNIVATFAAALMEPLPSYTPLIMGLIQIMVISAGIYTSKRFIPNKLKKIFPYLPGAILIILGFIRMV
ncbi:MAG: manganese efflux pump [Sporomusaceae bacterium]|nr:manganese efflux pump [Sporomusaceae bacterium]